MAYRDFTFEQAEQAFGLRTTRAHLFASVEPLAVPAWLPAQIERGRQLAPLISEKVRGEVFVMPIAQAVAGAAPGPLALFSGYRLDVDSSQGLTGEFDFLFARTEAVPRVSAPLLAVVEAKRGEVEAGIGQCLAQMVAARLFNERAGEPPRPIWGCVTSGEDWQFLQLNGHQVRFNFERLYLDNLGLLLAALVHCVSDPPATGPAPAGA